MRLRLFGLTALALTVGVVLVHGGAPAPVAKDVVDHEMKYLETEFKKAKILKKAERKVRMSAMILAAAHKLAGKDGDAKAAEALKIVKLMDSNHDDAKKAFADLVAGKVTGGPVNFKDAIEFEYVMRMFSSEKVGGFGLEAALEDLVNFKGPMKDDDAKKISVLVAKMGLIGEIAKHFPPEEKGAKTKKAWSAFNDDMVKAARTLSEAAAAKKGDQIGKLADHLSKTCTACHDVFR